jgi:hypothetical protein
MNGLLHNLSGRYVANRGSLYKVLLPVAACGKENCCGLGVFLILTSGRYVAIGSSNKVLLPIQPGKRSLSLIRDLNVFLVIFDTFVICSSFGIFWILLVHFILNRCLLDCLVMIDPLLQ